MRLALRCSQEESGTRCVSMGLRCDIGPLHVNQNKHLRTTVRIRGGSYQVGKHILEPGGSRRIRLSFASIRLPLPFLATAPMRPDRGRLEDEPIHLRRNRIESPRPSPERKSDFDRPTDFCVVKKHLVALSPHGFCAGIDSSSCHLR